MDSFKYLIIRKRKEKRMNREQFAEFLCISVSSLKFYETGEQVPQYPTLRKIAQRLEISGDEILGIGVYGTSAHIRTAAFRKPQKRAEQQDWIGLQEAGN